AIEIIKAANVELVISTGDMVAGQKPGLDYAKMWGSFHSYVTDPLIQQGFLFAPSPGNHDASRGTKYKSERMAYVDAFSEKLKSSFEFIDGSKFPLNYAFKLKGVLFIALDATSVGPLDPEQYAWLSNTLKNNQNVRG